MLLRTSIFAVLVITTANGFLYPRGNMTNPNGGNDVMSGPGPMDGNNMTGPIPMDGNDMTGPGPLDGNDMTGPGPLDGNDMTDPGPMGGNDMTGPSPLGGIDMTGPGPMGGNDMTGPGPMGGNDMTGPSPLGGIDMTGPDSLDGNDMTGPGPMGGNDMTGPGPMGGNDMTGPSPLGGIDMTGPDSLDGNDMTGPGPLDSNDMTDPGPLDWNNMMNGPPPMGGPFGPAGLMGDLLERKNMSDSMNSSVGGPQGGPMGGPMGRNYMDVPFGAPPRPMGDILERKNVSSSMNNPMGGPLGGPMGGPLGGPFGYPVGRNYMGVPFGAPARPMGDLMERKNMSGSMNNPMSGLPGGPMGVLGPMGGIFGGNGMNGPFGGYDMRSKNPGGPAGNGMEEMHPIQQCRQSCVSDGNCTSIEEMKMKMKISVKECRACVMASCGPYDTTNRTEVADCIADARMECNECPPIGALEQGQRKQCMRCVGQCFMKQQRKQPDEMNGQYGPPGGMPFIDPKFFGRPFFRKWQLPPKPLHTFVGLVSCISNFPACMNCPSPSESRQRLMNASLKCMDCMKAQCGPLDNTTGPNVMDCAAKARRDCDDCSPISEEYQARRKGCVQCFRRCGFHLGLLDLFKPPVPPPAFMFGNPPMPAGGMSDKPQPPNGIFSTPVLPPRA